MAVLAEAISVICRLDSISEKFQGGWPGFAAVAPNETLCDDGEVARVGFMHPNDVKAFVTELEGAGLVYLADGQAEDIIVVDQQRGPVARCTWIEFGHVDLDGNQAQRVAACRLAGSRRNEVVCPRGWSFPGSLSETFGFVPGQKPNDSLQFLRDEGGLEVYRSSLTGKEVYVGRTTRKGPRR